MADDNTIYLNTKGLDQMIKALTKNIPTIKVGVMGDKEDRAQGKTNSLVGAAHEYGTSRLPRRSFLRVPLTNFLNKEVEKAGGFDKDMFAEVVRKGSILPWMKKIAIMAEKIVLGAFNSAGYGAWKPSNMKYKKTKQTLVETQQLVKSIGSEVS